jgi:hypothetical protein
VFYGADLVGGRQQRTANKIEIGHCANGSSTPALKGGPFWHNQVVVQVHTTLH